MAVELLLALGKINLAIAAAVLLVLLVRKLLRAAFGARVAYAAWLIVPLAALAVLAPPRADGPPPASPTVAASQTVSGRAATDASPALEPDMVVTTRATVRRLSTPAMVLWAAVALGCLVVQAGQQRRFVLALGRLRPEAVPGGRVYHAQSVGLGPAVVGALSPRIVLPADFRERFSPEEQVVVLAHERAHLAAGDAQINALVALARCLFWFNPLVHLAASVIRVDQELACDAAVLDRHPQARRRYGEAMLKTQIAPLAPPLGCHWPAQGKRQLAERLTMLGRARPGLARRAAGAGLVLALAGGAGFAAWAAQPPQPASEVRASPQARRLGAQLLEALIQGDTARARDLVLAGADVNHRALGDGAPLIIAARRGQSGMVDLLLERGADPNLSVRGDGNALISAAGAGRLAITRTLVEHGADVNAFVFHDETPLINAARSGDLQVVEYLIRQGADPNLAVPFDPLRPDARRSPLGEARRLGHGLVVDYLRARGARA